MTPSISSRIRGDRVSSRMRGAAFLSVLAGATAGCGLLFPGSPASPPDSAEPESGGEAEALAESIPPGLGTLLQEEISLTLRRGELQLMVTPLSESITRLAAPDTYERLSALDRGYQGIFREETGSAVPFELFLVTMYSEVAELGFEPEALNLVNRGLRYRPVDIRPVTPDWDSRRLRPRQSVMAVYAFSRELDLERPIEVEYQEVRSRDWDRVLARIDAERARLRSRVPPN